MRSVTTLPALVAIVLLITVSSWWLIQLPDLLQQPGSALSNLSLVALATLLLMQVASLCLFAPFCAVQCREAGEQQLPFHDKSLLVASLIAPAGPFLVILMLASNVNPAAVVAAEVAVFLTGLAMIGIMQLLGRLRVHAEAVRLLQISTGVGAAVVFWTLRSTWLQWLS